MGWVNLTTPRKLIFQIGPLLCPNPTVRGLLNISKLVSNRTSTESKQLDFRDYLLSEHSAASQRCESIILNGTGALWIVQLSGQGCSLIWPSLEAWCWDVDIASRHERCRGDREQGLEDQRQPYSGSGSDSTAAPRSSTLSPQDCSISQ